MTQHDLARAADLPQPSIARIERGTVVPRAATLMELLKATGHELSVEPAIGTDVDRAPIRELLRLRVPERTRRAMRSRSRPSTRILRRLRRFGVRFVLIGELAEVAHGVPGSAPTSIEICPSLDREILERLATSLADLGATPMPAVSQLADDAAVAVETPDGRLLVTPHPAGTEDFENLWPNATSVLVDTALLVRVAALDDLIRIRRGTDHGPDRERLDLLGAVRDELDRTDRSDT